MIAVPAPLRALFDAAQNVLFSWHRSDGTEIGTPTAPVPITIVDGSGHTAGITSGALNVSGLSATIGATDTGSGLTVPLYSTSNRLNVNASATFTPPQSQTATAPAQTAVGTAAVVLLAQNLGRKRLAVQNTGTTRIKIGFGASPTQTAYHVCLPAGGSADDGSSTFLVDEMWLGSVSAISSTAGGTVVVEERT